MNHTTTTTVLIAIAAVTATLLAAGTVAAAIGSNHSAFAHYKKDYKKAGSNGISHGISNKQIIICITYGDNSPIYEHACSALLNLGPSPSPLKPTSTTTTTTSTPNIVDTSPPMKQGSSYTPSASQQSSPLKESTPNLSGSYPAADRMKSSNTNPEDTMNAWDSASNEFPFG
ncbi:MAG: hypothetical protein JO297_15650 [Nitrososphaeraceae archaeon]|nr:hypothetical protein [Nitrososphaeraceae archaeon]